MPGRSATKIGVQNTVQGICENIVRTTAIPGVTASEVVGAEHFSDCVLLAVRCRPEFGYGEDDYAFPRNGNFVEVRVINYTIIPRETETGPAPLFEYSMQREHTAPLVMQQCSASFLQKVTPTRNPVIAKWRRDLAASLEARPQPGDEIRLTATGQVFTVERGETNPRQRYYRQGEFLYKIKKITEIPLEYLYREPRKYDRALTLAPKLDRSWATKVTMLCKTHGFTDEENELACKMLLRAARRDIDGMKQLKASIGGAWDNCRCPHQQMRLSGLMALAEEWSFDRHEERLRNQTDAQPQNDLGRPGMGMA